MTRNSMGQFMAALRKANGMTQQEVADRLNVSNKAVSRWERDECAPDIILIPALAELYGVTCDELLRGERMGGSTAVQENKEGKADKKVERQRKALISRSLSSFKNMLSISIALSAVGLICMFGVSYGFYRPVIGFAVLLLLEAAATVLTVIAVNKLKEIKTESELFEGADAGMVERYDNCLGSLSFIGFFAVAFAVAISLPLVLCRSAFTESVMAFQSYLSYFTGIAAALALLFLLAREPYIRWITGRKKKDNRNRVLLNRIQLGAGVLLLILVVILPYFDEFVSETEIRTTFAAGRLIAYVLIAVIPVVLVVFLLREKENRWAVLLTGLRNVLLLPTVFILESAHIVGLSYNVMSKETYLRYDAWIGSRVFNGICWALLVVAAYMIAEKCLKKRRRKLQK